MVAKILVNRLKPILSLLVFSEWGAFMLSWSIIDNINWSGGHALFDGFFEDVELNDP